MDYQYYLNATNSDQGYDAPLVHELLEKLEKITEGKGTMADIENIARGIKNDLK